MVGHPPEKKFKKLVSSKSMKNCRVKVNDITNACAIFGPHLPGLGGITTRLKPGSKELVYIDIPRELYEREKNINFTVDVMFVNGLAFLVKFSRNIILFTTEHLPSRKAGRISSAITTVIYIYARGGFIIHVITMDMEFEKLKDAPDMELIGVNITAAREHVDKNEQAIRIIKEQSRCVMKTLVITGILNIHKQIVIHMIYFVTMILNAVPDTICVSEV